MRNISTFDLIVLILLIIGGINWGLVGLFGFNLVEAIFGVGSFLTSIIYLVVGLSAIYVLYRVFISRSDKSY